MMFEGLNLEASAGDALISVRVNSILENIILWGQFASALRKGGSLISWWDLVLGCWWARQGWIHFRLVVRWSVAADSLISFSGCWFASSAGLHAALLLCSSGGDGWCALESIYSAWSPGSKSSFGGRGGGSPQCGLCRCSTWLLQVQLRWPAGDGEKTLKVVSVIFRFLL
jgi:hypothetical protein